MSIAPSHIFQTHTPTCRAQVGPSLTHTHATMQHLSPTVDTHNTTPYISPRDLCMCKSLHIPSYRAHILSASFVFPGYHQTTSQGFLVLPDKFPQTHRSVRLNTRTNHMAIFELTLWSSIASTVWDYGNSVSLLYLVSETADAVRSTFRAPSFHKPHTSSL